MSWLLCSFMTCVLMLLFALVLLVDGFPSRCFFIYRVFLLLIKIPKKTCNCFMKPPEKRERMCHTSSQFHSISSGRVIPRSGFTSDSNQIRSLVQGLVLIHPIKWNLQFGCLANQTRRTCLLTNPKSGTGQHYYASWYDYPSYIVMRSSTLQIPHSWIWVSCNHHIKLLHILQKRWYCHIIGVFACCPISRHFID
jgi:hypothetical protein